MGHRCLAIGIALTIVASTSAAASAPDVPPLAETPRSAAKLAKSRRMTEIAAKHLEGAGPDDAAPIVTALVAAVTVEPANIRARYLLAKAYRAVGDKAAAYAILTEFKVSACDECLQALVDGCPQDLGGNHDWDPNDSDDPTLRAICSHLVGRRTELTPAAEDIASFDSERAGRHVFAESVRVTGSPKPGTYRGRAAFERWLGKVSVFELSSEGVLTCGKTCCHFVKNYQGTDITYYLHELCFAKGALVSLKFYNP